MFTYSYDLAGRLSQIEYPSETGIVAKFDDGATPTPNPGWNANGQLTHLRYLKSGAHLHSFEYDYDDAGNRKTFIDTPGTQTGTRWEYSYTWLNQLKEVRMGPANTTPPMPLQRVYEYDESDNRAFMDDHIAGVTYRYVYDAADQLEEIQVTDPADFQSRDPLDFVTDETFDFDADGNMIERVLDPNGTPQSTAYTWDAFDRLLRVATPVNVTSNSYDTGGIRKRRTSDDGLAVRSTYTELLVLNEAEEATSGVSLVNYLVGPVALGLQASGSGFLYFIMDGLSSVRSLVNASGNEVAHYVHDEFGGRIEISETGGSVRKTYVGGLSVHDETPTTGLLYMRHRWYDPGLGRFLSQDPIGMVGGLNLYAYVSNNPTTMTDPTGLDPTYNPFDGPPHVPSPYGQLGDVPGVPPYPELFKPGGKIPNYKSGRSYRCTWTSDETRLLQRAIDIHNRFDSGKGRRLTVNDLHKMPGLFKFLDSMAGKSHVTGKTFGRKVWIDLEACGSLPGDNEQDRLIELVATPRQRVMARAKSLCRRHFWGIRAKRKENVAELDGFIALQ